MIKIIFCLFASVFSNLAKDKQHSVATDLSFEEDDFSQLSCPTEKNLELFPS